MKLGLRTKLVGTLVGAIVISSAISAIAARNTMATDLNRLANQQIASGSTGFAGYLDQKRDTVKLLVHAGCDQRGRSAPHRHPQQEAPSIADRDRPPKAISRSSPSSTRKGTCSRAPTAGRRAQP